MRDDLDPFGWEPEPGVGRGRVLAAGVLTGVLCLTVAGGAPAAGPSPAAVAGVSALPAPPGGPSWAPAPVLTAGLRSTATAGQGAFRLHTAGGDVDFLPGVDLGLSTPGHRSDEASISAEQYRSWFAAMDRLGLRAVRIATIHPPAFYRELAAHNRRHPTRPLYLVQGVRPPVDPSVNVFDPAVTRAFQAELRDASAAVAGRRHRAAGDSWDADVTAWLAAWIIGDQFDAYAVQASDKRNTAAPPATGRYFRSTADATPTERWLAARMDDLATVEAAAGRSAPVAFANRPGTDPLRHPDEPVPADDLIGLDAGHITATAAWPAGTFAGYDAYPYRPDFLRQGADPAGRSDPYADYLTALRRHHGAVPVLVTGFGVPSSLGSAQQAPLGRGQGDHSEQQANRIDAELLRLIARAGLAGGFVCCWVDEWSAAAPNTIGHADDDRRRFWSDALSSDQHAGLVALDPAGPPGAPEQRLLDAPDGWPARRVTARIDEGYLHLRITLGDATPGRLSVGLDVLPALTGAPAPATGDRRADAAVALDLVARTGQAYLRAELDPVPLDHPVPAAPRGPQPAGWRRLQLLLNPELVVPSTGVRRPAELADAGVLRYGAWDPADPDADSRALWRRDGDDLVLRVPWAAAGFADPSTHRVAVPQPTGGVARLALAPSPGVAVSVCAIGTDQQVGTVTWDDWQSVGYTTRLKQGARLFRDAVVEVGAH